ncbi:HD domain-containing protein [Microlunatus ginsengisoli]|uniref:HD domain-containing protein n=1 Tax=Microlunatus ginsengisoli TaxID=363863 RepID=A0ABP7ALJ4_9ACTN
MSRAVVLHPPARGAAAEHSVPAVDAGPVVRLADLCLEFGRVERLCRHPDGVRQETDTDHTVMLGVVGCAFAARHLPWLDPGLVAQYALVHDLVEVYAGDTVTLRIDAATRRRKQAAEAAAAARLRAEFGGALPWLPDTIAAYEDRAAPEARYVKALDKLLPKITHLLNDAVVLRDEGMGRAELAARYAAQLVELHGYASDFPPLFELRRQLLDLLWDAVA